MEPPPCITRYQWPDTGQDGTGCKWEIVRKYFPHPIMSSSIHCPGGGQGPGTFLAFIFGAGRNNSSGGVIYLVGKIFGQVGLGWAGLGWAGLAGLGWVQEGILNSNLCQDWKTGLNEGRPRGATALPQSYKYFKINFK